MSDRRPLSVVIADDNEWVRELIRAALEPYFVIQRSVSTGRALIDAVVADQPDAVVAEVAMPVLGGLEAMDEVRELGDSTPFVIISTHAEARAYCLQAGAAAFVCKTDIAAELARAVWRACGPTSCTGRLSNGSRDGRLSYQDQRGATAR